MNAQIAFHHLGNIAWWLKFAIKGDAVTVISVLSLKRLAVSFTTANASNF
jgi:hypothetical protein